ncbi:protein ALP1-like [Zingiber officinale]|uniref:protein ALP1-like n=1 Tax=Zingiber officinale TaxID=94328 RepID=UPI001C4B5D08|nr:protein ALP1-like [Zingiber officinale]
MEDLTVNYNNIITKFTEYTSVKKSEVDLKQKQLKVEEIKAKVALSKSEAKNRRLKLKEYLRRQNADDVQRLLQMHDERHDFPGISRNDIIVLYEYPIFNNVLQGNMLEINFTVNDTTYTKGYYLTDGIYPEWATFVKTFPCPEDPKRKLFKERQESTRKDVEWAFGVLQSRWAIVRGPAHYWYRKKLKQIMLVCIILHNMIVEDEGGHMINWYNDKGDEPAQPIHGSNRGFQDYLRTNSELRDTQVHHQLRADLVEHIWGQYNNNL